MPIAHRGVPGRPSTIRAYLGSFSFFRVSGAKGRRHSRSRSIAFQSFERERLCSADPPSVTLVLAPIVQGAPLEKSQVEIRGITLE